MKKNIFLYLFAFVFLIALVLYINGSKVADTLNQKVTKLKVKETRLLDSIQKLNIKILDVQHFSLENNDYALENFDHLNIENPERYIADKLLETNERKGDNPLIPYEGMEGHFKINKINVLNHKWILAEFTDGKHWGEAIIEYELKDDLGIDFRTEKHLLYSATF